jgi:hypothetical protein
VPRVNAAVLIFIESSSDGRQTDKNPLAGQGSQHTIPAYTGGWGLSVDGTYVWRCHPALAAKFDLTVHKGELPGADGEHSFGECLAELSFLGSEA